MREFLEKQAELAKQKEEAKLEKRKRRKKKLEKIEEAETGRHLFVDPKYDEQKQKIAAELEEALDRGIGGVKKEKTSAESNGAKCSKSSSEEDNNEAVAEVVTPPPVVVIEEKKKVESKKSGKDVDTKLIDWMGVGDLEVSSSDDEDDEENGPVKST
jgi:hypothetical protein